MPRSSTELVRTELNGVVITVIYGPLETPGKQENEALKRNTFYNN
jgi:hypothetical protein